MGAKVQVLCKRKFAELPRHRRSLCFRPEGRGRKEVLSFGQHPQGSQLSERGAVQAHWHGTGPGRGHGAQWSTCAHQTLWNRFAGRRGEAAEENRSARNFDSFGQGQAFMLALQTLDVGQTKKPAEKEVKKALKVFREYLEKEDKEFHRSLTWLASQSAALYLAAMALLKDTAFFQDPKGWISKVAGKQKEEVRAWQKSPNDTKKMDKALLAEFMKKVQENEPDKDKKRKASDSSSEASAAPAAKSKSSSETEASGSEAARSGSDSSSGSAAESDSDKSSTNRKKDKRKSKQDKKIKKEPKEKTKDKEKAKKEQEKAKAKADRKKKEKAAKKRDEKKKKKEEKEAKKARQIWR